MVLRPDQMEALAPGLMRVRFVFGFDMNGDGVVSISDIWLWIKWVFFAPGDFIIIIIMNWAPKVAAFFEFTMMGVASGIISLLMWWLISAVIWATGTPINESEE